MKIWMAVTQDRYQFPVAIADSAVELAAMLGVDQVSIRSSISHMKRQTRKTNRGLKRRYYCVEVSDDEEVEG